MSSSFSGIFTAEAASPRFALLGADLEAERAASSLIDAQERRLLAVAALERAIQPDRAFAPVAVVARSALEGEGEVR